MRGNINRKYLKRRRNWFERNVILLIAIVVIVVATIFGVLFCINKLKDNAASNVDAVQGIQKAADDTTKAVNWIVDAEPTKSTITYVAPTNAQFPYFIKVNRALCCVTVYGIDANGAYTIPVVSFACSVGSLGQETIVGENYTTTDKYTWRLMVDYSYAQYAFRIDGGYLFHSVPYTTQNNDSLETDQFNKLGSPASLGCIRLNVANVKWIYDNCPAGTKVTIYDDVTTPGVLGKPETIKIPTNSPNAGWDPTDPNVNNPWLKCKSVIEGAKNITTKVGQKVDLKTGVSAKDTCGNDITSKLVTVGRYTFDQAGEYTIKYVATDAIGSTAEVSVKLIVTE